MQSLPNVAIVDQIKSLITSCVALCVCITIKDYGGITAIYAAGNLSNHKSAAQLLVAGASPTVVAPFAPASGTLLNKATANGSVA